MYQMNFEELMKHHKKHHEEEKELNQITIKLLNTCEIVMETIENATVINDIENIVVEEWLTGLHDKVFTAIFEAKEFLKSSI